MKTLILILLLTSIAFVQGEDFTVPPGYEIVARDGNRVEIKDLATGFVTPHLLNWDSEKPQTPIIAETQDELPRQWYYFETLATLPWFVRVYTGDLNNSGYAEIYGRIAGETYLDTLVTPWQFDHITLDSLGAPVYLGDTDFDGNGELLTLRSDGFYLYESVDFNSYPDSLIWYFPDNIGNQRASKIGDVDGDGYGEVLYYYEQRAYGYQIFELDSAGNYLWKTAIPFFNHVYDYTGEPSFGDVDGDGQTEIFAGGIHGEVIVYENVADDSFEFVWMDYIDMPSAYSTEYLGDTDGDGHNEFMIAGNYIWGPGGILFCIYESHSDNNYQLVYSININRYWFSNGDIWVGDFTGEGFNEIALCTGWNITILRAVGNDNWEEITRYRNENLDLEIYKYNVSDDYPDFLLNLVRGPVWMTRMIWPGGSYYPGDVNNNGGVNGTDVIYLVSYLKTGAPPIQTPCIRADANGDCDINLLDVTYLVNYFKGRVPAPEPGWCPYILE